MLSKDSPQHATHLAQGSVGTHSIEDVWHQVGITFCRMPQFIEPAGDLPVVPFPPDLIQPVQMPLLAFGYIRQQGDFNRLIKHGLTFDDVVEAVSRAHLSHPVVRFTPLGSIKG